ncbi:MAG: hypothetical protein P8Y74_14340, partial [Desulfobacterales bacterium]
MVIEDTIDTVTFDHSGESLQVSFTEISDEVVSFLDYYGVPTLMGRPFCDVIGDGDGHSKFLRLMTACGFTGDPRGFCSELVRQLTPVNRRDGTPVRINGVDLPQLLLVALLEKLRPGNKFTSVRTVAQLEKQTGMTVPEAEREDL